MLRGLDQKVKHWKNTRIAGRKKTERSETRSGKSRGRKMFRPGFSRDKKRKDGLH